MLHKNVSMDPTQHGSNLDANHDALIISVITVVSVLSFSALLFRLASRRIKRVSLFWDDYLAIVSWVSPLSLRNSTTAKPKLRW